MRRSKHHSSRGASLVEALVAMAVMAFGMLAIVGVQQTLRVNSDLSKQRNEATRLAEQELEKVRTDAGSGETEFDSIAIGLTGPTAHSGNNATYSVERTVSQAADDRSLTTYVVVKWPDRTGVERQVVMHDMLARVDPMLSGLVRAEKPLTPVGRRKSRHPTIPNRAHDLGDGTSTFKPIKAGTLAWIFNNSTGEITHTCTGVTPTEDPLTSKAGCTSVGNYSAQLLSGEIRFNLRGAALDMGTESALKPVAAGEVAWVINNATKNLVRICPVSALVSTAALTPAMLSSGCTEAATTVSVTPFTAADAGYTLVAADSESPSWPSIPATVGRDTLVPASGIQSMDCYSDSKEGSLDHVTTTAQKTIEYFCIIIPTDGTGWGARTKVVPVKFSDGSPSAIWTTGSSAGQYKVCRYTTANTAYTTNVDHPNTYAQESASCGSICTKVTGNLINQNFLVIDGAKSCPTDVSADPAGGDLINSNTLQHQPTL